VNLRARESKFRIRFAVTAEAYWYVLESARILAELNDAMSDLHKTNLADDVFFAATGVSSGELLKGYVILVAGHRLSL